MDPLTQGLIGGVAAQSLSKSDKKGTMGVIGALAGMAPDLDIFIRSSENPMLAIEYHRHFTHSLFFVPLGAFIVASLLYLFLKFIIRRQVIFKDLYKPCFWGYLTHGLLDACTSYGTLLYWPFSRDRVAWDNLSIIDPIFTLLLLFIFIAYIFPKLKNVRKFCTILFSFYFLLSFYQSYRLLEFQKDLSQERGHNYVRGRVSPSLGNIILWRSVYESEGIFYSDLFRKLPFRDVQILESQSHPKFDTNQLLESLPNNSLLKKNIITFRWFADDYLIKLESQNKSLLLGDFRYASYGKESQVLWGVQFNPQKPKEPAHRVNFFSNRRESLIYLWYYLKGETIIN